MEIVVASCLILITMALWAGMIALILAALQVRRAAQAVEAKVYQVGEQIDRLRDVVSAVGSFADMFRSPWVKGLGLALGAATTYFGIRSRRAAACDAEAAGLAGRRDC